MNLYDSRILLIDDNIELADMVRDMLRRNGYVNVSCSHTCEQGMRMFREEQSQLVILDIMLPDGDGFTLFRRYGISPMYRSCFSPQRMRTTTGSSVWDSARTTTSPSPFSPRNCSCV